MAGRSRAGGDGRRVREAAFPAFPLPLREAVFQTHVALVTRMAPPCTSEETHWMVRGRTLRPSPPWPPAPEQGQPVLRAPPAAIVHASPLPASPTLPEARSFSFIIVYTGDTGRGNGPSWRASCPSSAPPGPSLRTMWLRVPRGGDRRNAWQDPAPRPWSHVSRVTPHLS